MAARRLAGALVLLRVFMWSSIGGGKAWPALDLADLKDRQDDGDDNEAHDDSEPDDHDGL